ncbi:uncharacterized protein LOC100878986 isoform X3 [Megachile rotundata]|uniref:uncharacterized protein LOC100878986 isoform X3 n=1 Tax=Megachile rotundata TaxID=143995 RepID=UPI000614D3E8|nr:PREDICTED: uncharacterized protein LOC100878986 isoform X3 [Megachile rotundata]XP_012144159.1 PREDICTED: uncharacterized protein LOC100878986 isoform X3 [Megachile rotundata]
MVYSGMFIGMLPLVIQFGISISEKDVDGIIDEFPHILTAVGTMIKFCNISLNHQHIKTLLDLILKDWEVLTNELHMLNKITTQGNRIANLYRTTLLSFLMVFIAIPLIPPALDIIAPLNVTRPRQPMFRANYVIIKVDDHFFVTYVHMASVASLGVFIIVTVDSLYMLIIHHACGLFDVCGYQVQMATKNSILSYEEFRQCVITHHKALHFFNTLQECSQNMNLMLVGINMLLISMTAVQVTMSLCLNFPNINYITFILQIILYIDQPADAMRFILFLIAEKFHLLVISLFGQILLNYASSLPEKIFSSNWYEMPVKYQKILYMMIIRCNKTCNLSAGGLYDMNIENFGKTVKACMSYFTMFLSLRD